MEGKRVEEWKSGRREDWKEGILEDWKIGGREGRGYFNIFVFCVEFFRKMTSFPFFINAAKRICFFKIGMPTVQSQPSK